MAGRGPGERNLEAGTRLILEEARDMRVEMRADRRRADEERRQADERIDEKLGARVNGLPGHGNGGGASPR